MPTSDLSVAAGTVVRVPFPHSDAETLQRRPALVIAALGPTDAPLLLWVLMITSAENRGWRGDVMVPDAQACGLPIPSVIRTAKIATIDRSRAQPLGTVPSGTLAAVRAELGALLELGR